MNDKIVEMLSSGLPQTVVAKACGVTDGYISQLMADEGIRAQVTEAKIVNVEKGLKADSLIDEIELTALEKMKNLLPFMTRPMDVARVFQTVNGAKKHTGELSGLNNGREQAPLVNISISVEAARQLKLSSDNQVVEVDGRSMATMPAKQLNGELAARRESRPQISDATTAQQLLDRIEIGIPADSLAHVI